MGSKMKGKIAAMIFLLNFASFVALNAQWARTYGGSEEDIPRTIVQASEGGYLVAGYTESFGNDNRDFWIIKFDSGGNIEWQRKYGQNFGDSFFSIQKTNDEGFVLVGGSAGTGWSAGGYDICILKLSLTGEKEWEINYRGSDSDYAYSIQQTNNGGYILTGCFSYRDILDSDICILKLTSTGGIEWCKTYKGSMTDRAHSIQQTSDEGYILVGYTESFGAGYTDIWILKLNFYGEIEWQKTYGGSHEEEAYSIQQTVDGGYIVAGFTSGFGAGVSDYWILKLNFDGSIEWQKTYGSSKNERASYVRQTSDWGYIVAGNTESFGAGASDIWVLKLNIWGDIEWQKMYGGSQIEEASSIQQTDDGGYIVAGFTETYGAGNEDFLILKLLTNGDISSSCIFIEDSNAEVTNTVVIPVDTNIILEDKEIPSFIPSFSPQESEAVVYSLCSGQRSLSITASSGGTTSPQPETYIYDHAEITSISAKPDVGYKFTGWSGDVSGTDKTISFTMDSDKSIQANFSLIVLEELWERAKRTPCFIATAVYGSPLHPHVKILQEFRDKFLIPSKLGHKFVSLYYKYSPPIAEFITKHKALRIIVRLWLLPAVALGYLMVHLGPIKTAIIFALTFIAPFLFFRIYRRKRAQNA